MPTYVLFFAIGVIALAAMANWRLGIILAVYVGFLQDILRKMTPGEPIIYQVIVVAIFGAAFAGALNYRIPGRSLAYIRQQYPGLVVAVMFFVVWVLFQVMRAYLATGSVVVAGIGALAYLTPFVALLVTYYYGCSQRHVNLYLVTAIVLTGLMISGVYLDVAGYKTELIDPVGQGLYVYPESGGILRLPNGFFRSAENAAWFGAASVCFLIILVTCRQWRYGMVPAGAIGLFILIAVLLTGRRKMVVEMVVFIIVYGAFLLYFLKHTGRLAMFLFVIAAVFVVAQEFYLEDTQRLDVYLERPAGVLGDTPDRVYTMVIQGPINSIQRHGFFGVGAGLGSQGAQHFTTGGPLRGGVEGGAGKILAELGVPGLLFFVMVIVNLAKAVWRACVAAAREGPSQVALTAGLTAFLAVSMGVFANATQIFGDPFVLITLGIVLGIVLSTPVRLGLENETVPVESSPVPLRRGL